MANPAASLTRRLLASAMLIAAVPLILAAARINAVAGVSPNRATLDMVRTAVADQTPSAVLAQARAIAVAHPLEPAPFFLAAAVAGTERQPARAITLLQEVVRRRAGFGPARAWLASYNLSLGRSRAAIDQADAAMRADGRLRPQLIPLLLTQLDTREGRRYLIEVVGRGVPWAADFISAIQARGGAPDTLFTLLSTVPPNGVSAALIDQRRVFIESRIAAGDPERAYLAWISFLPQGAVNRVAPLYDGDFARLPGSAPFNWTLNAGEGADVAYDYEGDRTASFLSASYSGGAALELASQSLFLSPGAWRLTIQVRGEQPADAGTLRWRIRCSTDGRELASVELRSLGSAWRPVAAVLSVPAEGCALQQLSLLGAPGDAADPVSVQVRAMALARVGQP